MKTRAVFCSLISFSRSSESQGLVHESFQVQAKLARRLVICHSSPYGDLATLHFLIIGEGWASALLIV